MNEWGLARDEFVDNGNWPHQIYVREARRMVADFVMTENHLTGKVPTEQPVGMGSYNMDSTMCSVTWTPRAMCGTRGTSR